MINPNILANVLMGGNTPKRYDIPSCDEMSSRQRCAIVKALLFYLSADQTSLSDADKDYLNQVVIKMRITEDMANSIQSMTQSEMTSLLRDEYYTLERILIDPNPFDIYNSSNDIYNSSNIKKGLVRYSVRESILCACGKPEDPQRAALRRMGL